MKIVLKLAIAVIFVFGHQVVFGAGSCTDVPVKMNMAGTWIGTDSYSFQIRQDRRGWVCISIIEPHSKIVRTVRDIVVVNSEIRHISYYTPSTHGYVIYVNIKITGDEMKFHWFSSYDNEQGDDTYLRQKPKQRSPDKRTLSNLNDRRHDHGFGTDLFLDEAFQNNTQIFFEEVAVNDVFAFHVADGLADL